MKKITTSEAYDMGWEAGNDDNNPFAYDTENYDEYANGAYDLKLERTFE